MPDSELHQLPMKQLKQMARQRGLRPEEEDEFEGRDDYVSFINRQDAALAEPEPPRQVPVLRSPEEMASRSYASSTYDSAALQPYGDARYDPYGGGAGGGGGVDQDQYSQAAAQARNQGPEVEDLLQQWLKAKTAKDYSTADSIRSRLRSMNVDPDRSRSSRDSRQDSGGGGGGGYGADAAYGQSSYSYAPPPAIAALPHALTSVLPPVDAHPWDHYLRAPGGVAFLLQEWQRAKTARQWDQADALRKFLRSKGIEPERDGAAMAGGTVPAGDGWAGYNDDVLMQEWQRARENRDWARADALRDELRSRGVDCDGTGRATRASDAERAAGGLPDAPAVPTLRQPQQHSGGGASRGGGGAADAEQLLQQWRQAKSVRDYATADSIRTTLRNMGVDPDAPRGTPYVSSDRSM